MSSRAIEVVIWGKTVGAVALGSFDQFAREAGLPHEKRDEVRAHFHADLC